MCQLYGVTRAGYYAWRHREDCPRRQRDRQLTRRIESIYQASRGTYGSPRIHGALKAQGECVGRKRIEWLMRSQGLKARAAKLYRAVCHRRPRAGLLFHTDRGIEYAAYAFRERLAELGVTQSMNRPGGLADNAHVESFFHSMKSDIIHGAQFADERTLARAVRRYIPSYNGRRLHSSLDYRSPVAYEQEMG
ncbi:MAG: IS3 family transposase [bacterium]